MLQKNGTRAGEVSRADITGIDLVRRMDWSALMMCFLFGAFPVILFLYMDGWFWKFLAMLPFAAVSLMLAMVSLGHKLVIHTDDKTFDLAVYDEMEDMENFIHDAQAWLDDPDACFGQPADVGSTGNAAEEIRREDYLKLMNWSHGSLLDALDKTAVGQSVAQAVADCLAEGRVLAYRHRDYCGHGLVCEDGLYKVVSVHDFGYYRDIAVFTAQSDFVSYLARQSDWSLSGACPAEELLYTEDTFQLNNQRLTRQRLQDFLNDEGGGMNNS